MKAGRWIGMGVVLLAVFVAVWWMQAPAGDPPKKGLPASRPPEVRHEETRRPEADAPPDEEPPQEPRAEAPPPDQGRQDEPSAQPGQYNAQFLPQPSPSYQDDPRRFAKTYRTHADLAGPYWKQVAEVLPDPELGQRARDVAQRLADPDADPLETTHAELMLDSAIRAGGAMDPHLTNLMDYLNNLASTVIQDGDPAAIPRPETLH